MLHTIHNAVRGLPSAAILLAALAAPAAAEPHAVEVEGTPLSWHDELRFTVHGVGCSPTLGPVVMQGVTIEVPHGTTADVPLDDDCTGGETAAPYAVTGVLPTLPPGLYTLQVRYGGASLTAPLQIHDVAAVRLELPAVASSADPSPVGVTLLGGCHTVDTAVSDGVVTIRLGPCPILPIGAVFTLTPTIGPLPPGTYEVRVLDERRQTGAAMVARGTLRVRAAERCLPGEQRLCLHDGRFAVSGAWRAFDGSTGAMLATPLAGNEESGLLSFFSADRSELTVKVLNGCGVNDRWWAFVSSSSTVEYEITVADTVTGHSKVYRKELHEVPSLLADTSFEVCP